MKYPYAKDGEYWLFPVPFAGKKVRIYCDEMRVTPTEYITLKTFNRGNYPNLSYKNCQDEDSEMENNRADEAGSFVFAKVRVDIKVRKTCPRK